MNLLAKAALLLAGLALGVAGCSPKPTAVVGPLVCSVPQNPDLPASRPTAPGHADLTGRTRIGKASFYARRFARRLMANGRRMDPSGANAASRTLPLGSTAKVINVRTGQSAIVSIEDRGPYVGGRILDLSPATARKIGITSRIGVAEVKVAPIAVRLPDGSMKAGAGRVAPICQATTS